MSLDDLLANARTKLPLLRQVEGTGSNLSPFTTQRQETPQPPQQPQMPAPPSPPQLPASLSVAPVPSPQVNTLQPLQTQTQNSLAGLAFSPLTQPQINPSIGPMLNGGQGGWGNPKGDLAAVYADSIARARGVEPFGGSYSGPRAKGGGARVINLARTQVGVPYVFGDLDPAGGGSSGIDCSGLTKWVYGRLGIELPHSAAQQSAMFPHVTAKQMKPGDLVFFSYGRLGSGVADHVGIYEGNGRMLAASSGAGHVIDSQPIDWDNFIYGGHTPLAGPNKQGPGRTAPTPSRPQRTGGNPQQR